MSFEFIPRNYEEALLIPHWKATMDEKMEVLLSCGTWDLVARPAETNIVTCRWVFTVKHMADGIVDISKAHLLAKGFN